MNLTRPQSVNILICGEETLFNVNVLFFACLMFFLDRTHSIDANGSMLRCTTMRTVTNMKWPLGDNHEPVTMHDVCIHGLLAARSRALPPFEQLKTLQPPLAKASLSRSAPDFGKSPLLRRMPVFFRSTRYFFIYFFG